MGFPYLAPFKKRVREKLEEREKDSHLLTHYMPFVLLSSAAVVATGEVTQIEDALKPGPSQLNAKYHGCVIANTTEKYNLYQTGQTIVGYDLNGKAILVEGEMNRRVSVPIITKVDIDTDGGNNTLKTAEIEIKVFTLKQLEMLELFFFRPTMNVVLEFGWSSDLKKNKALIDSVLYAKKNWQGWYDEYIATFSIKKEDNKISKKKQDYIDTLAKTDYDYDFMAGKVTNFTITPAEDGTYAVKLEVTAGNELQLWPPVTGESEESKTATASKQSLLTWEQFRNKVESELVIDPNIMTTFGKDYIEKEFFNFGAYNLTQKDITASKTPYVSFKFIIDLLNRTKLVGNTFLFTWKDEDGNPVVPITSREYIISTTSDFILPGDLPKIVVAPNSKKENTIVVDVKSGKKESLLINGKSFNFKKGIKIYDYNTGKKVAATELVTLKRVDDEKITQNFESIGNLCHAFFSYERLKYIWNSSHSGAEVINGVLDSFNSNMFGLCKLELQVPEEGGAQKMEIIDTKLPIPNPPDNTQTYRFNVHEKNSIIRGFEFSMELSTLAQAQAMYATQLAINEAAKNGQGTEFEEPAVNTYSEKTAGDLSFAKNTDGFFSVNVIEHQLVKDAIQSNRIEKPKNTVPDVTKLNETITAKYIKFKQNPLNKSETPKNYIYQDAALIQRYLRPKTQQGTSALTYLDITIKIDGISGISCGEFFNIGGVPEIYNLNGYFQILNTKHSIDETGWTTTLEAGYRIRT